MKTSPLPANEYTCGIKTDDHVDFNFVHCGRRGLHLHLSEFVKLTFANAIFSFIREI